METPESWFHRRATDYVEAQVLFHLNQVGVFALLSEGGSHTPRDIAEALELQVGPTTELLEYVFGVDHLLERDVRGAFSLSEFGRKVVERFSRVDDAAGRRIINFFDVRVGAYGPVWSHLDQLLTGQARYGVDLHRRGEFAENGVSKLALNFWPSLLEHVEEAEVDSLLEVGLTTGLIEKLGQSYPELTLYGLDRSESSIRHNAADAEAKGVRNIEWIQGDFFDQASWSRAVDGQRPGLIFSLHFHELMARGEAAFLETLRALRTLLPGWSMLAFEQPLLAAEDRAKISETLWLYSQSNVLIHHLIGNGRIRSREDWIEMGRRAGCRSVTDRPCDYLGYRAFCYQF